MDFTFTILKLTMLLNLKKHLFKIKLINKKKNDFKKRKDFLF